MNIGLFSTFDNYGAGNATLRLHNGLTQIGQKNTLFVKYKSTDASNVINLTSSDTHNIIFDKLAAKYFANNIHEGNTMCSALYPSVGFDFLSFIKDFDVINLHWVTQFLSLEAVVHMRQMGKPVIWTLHDQNLMTGACHYTHGCEKYKKDCSSCPQLKDNPFDITKNILAAKKRYLPKDVVIVTPSRWLADCARESAVLKEHRIEVIPNSLDTQSFLAVDKIAAKRFFGIPETAKVILFGATALKEFRKGFSELLTATELLCEDRQIQSLLNDQQMFILLFGETSPLIEKLGVPYRALGYLEDDYALNMAYSAADVLALPSLEDNLPNVMLESMACGTPVVAFAIGGMPDFILNGENGYLAPVGNSQQFAQRLKEVLLGPSMQGFCRQFAEEQFSLDVQAKRYSDLFEDVKKASLPTICKHVPVMFPEISEAIMPWVIDISRNISCTYDDLTKRVKKLKKQVTISNVQEKVQAFLCKNSENKAVIFGAGKGGRNVLGLLGDRCSFFVDNDKKKWGSRIGNIPVMSPAILLEENKEHIILIIASRAADEIVLQLQEMGLYKDIEYLIFDLDLLLFDEACVKSESSPKDKEFINISPFNFQEFVYAKKSHLSLLHNYEQELYKCRIDFKNSDLKRYQDLLIFAFIKQNMSPGTRILEVGGGYSRLLDYFCKDYECWNIDPFEGLGSGPTELKPIPYRLVRDYMGNFNAELPDNYFDFVFSISALEHIPTDEQTLSNVVDDINRVLKGGGYSLHTLDSLVKDNQFNFLHPFTFKAASQPNSIIKLPDTAEILKDPDIYFMTKEAYDYGWKHITKAEYEAFGSPTSINLLWVNS